MTINAINIKNDEGKAIVNLFKKGDEITKEPYLQSSSKIANGKAVIVFVNLPYGEYADMLWQDKNSNGDLDHRWGMPAEPMGFSNNWKLSLFSGMPSFEKLKFQFTAQKAQCNISIK